MEAVGSSIWCPRPSDLTNYYQSTTCPVLPSQSTPPSLQLRMASPAAVLVSNGAICPHARPSAAAFLDSTPGAYTTARGTLLWWPRHLRRLAESTTLLARSHPHLLGLPLRLPRSRALDLDFLSIQSLVNPSVRVAIHEMRTRLPVTKDEHLALTALVRGAGADSISGSGDGLDVFVHVGKYAPPVFGESGARLAVAGRGRDAATAKYAPWARSVLYGNLNFCKFWLLRELS